MADNSPRLRFFYNHKSTSSIQRMLNSVTRSGAVYGSPHRHQEVKKGSATSVHFRVSRTPRWLIGSFENVLPSKREGAENIGLVTDFFKFSFHHRMLSTINSEAPGNQSIWVMNAQNGKAIWYQNKFINFVILNISILNCFYQIFLKQIV